MTINTPSYTAQIVTSADLGSTCPAGGTDPRCTTTVLIASLHIVNATDVTSTKPTGVVRMTVIVTNTGQVPYVGITVGDSLAGTVDDAIGNGDSAATSGSLALVPAAASVDWTGDVAPGASVTITGSAIVKNPDLADLTMTSLMITSAPAGNCPPGGTDPLCATSVTVLIPALTITQTANTTTTTPGSTVGYTVTIHNSGLTAYTAATVRDLLGGAQDDATYGGDATATSGVLTYPAPVLTWTGDLAIGQTVTISYTVTVHNPDLGDKLIVNLVTSNELGSSCPAGGTDQACSTLVIVQVPALDIAIRADTTTTRPGGTVGYTVTVRNLGQTAYPGATVTIALADVVDDATYAGGATATAGGATAGGVTFLDDALTWTGTVSLGGTVVITYAVTVTDPDAGDKLLTTSVSSPAPGSTCGLAAQCADTVTVLIPGLAVSTTASGATATPGDHVTFIVTLENTGQTLYPNAAFSTSLSAILDDATFDGQITATIGTATYTAPGLSWAGTLHVGDTAVITYTVTVRNPDPGNKVLATTVIAPAAGSTCRSGSTGPACTATVTVLVPALAIRQSASTASTTPGGIVGDTITITITNTGQTVYTGAVVSNSFVGVVTDATYNNDADASAGVLSIGASTSTWTGDVLVGATVTITYSITVKDPDPGDKLIENNVTSSVPGSSCAPGGTLPA